MLLDRIEALRSDPGRGSTNLYGSYMAGLELAAVEEIGSAERSLALSGSGLRRAGRVRRGFGLFGRNPGYVGDI